MSYTFQFLLSMRSPTVHRIARVICLPNFVSKLRLDVYPLLVLRELASHLSMLGLPYLQHLVSLDQGSSPLEDGLSFDTDSSLDILVINPFQFRTAVQAPLEPSRHKACRPSQAQVEGILRAREVLQVKYSESRNCDVGSNASDQENAEDEDDLADMVHDFMENGSCGQHGIDASDSDTGTAVSPKLCHGLQVLTTAVVPSERDIASTVASVIIGTNELDLFCPNGSIDCRGSCIRRLAVKRLRMSGYNASVCKSKWLNTDKIPGGEYEYIDVSADEENVQREGLIIDIDFRSQFEIARPSQHYQTALKSLPVIFVGKPGMLEQALQIMAEAAKCSLKHNSMHLPPWRTLDYMRAKWLSPRERSRVDPFNWRATGSSSSQCREQLRRLKGAVKADVEKKGLALKPTSNAAAPHEGEEAPPPLLPDNQGGRTHAHKNNHLLLPPNF